MFLWRLSKAVEITITVSGSIVVLWAGFFIGWCVSVWRRPTREGLGDLSGRVGHPAVTDHGEHLTPHLVVYHQLQAGCQGHEKNSYS